MSHSLDPANAAISYKLTDQGAGNYRLRRVAVTGSQLFGPLDLTNGNLEFLRMVGTAMAADEGGQFTDLTL